MSNIIEITSKVVWEGFLVETGGDYPFFQSWSWGEVQKKLGYGVMRVGLQEGKKLVGILQLIDVVAKRGHYIYLRHGPVCREFSFTFMGAFLDFSKKHAKEKHASFIRISRFPKTKDSEDFFNSQKSITSPLQTTDAQVCWVLDITKSEEELLKNMRKSHRYIIKKSQTLPIRIIQSSNKEDLKKFLPLYESLSVRKHFIAHKGVMEEFEEFSANKHETLFLAEYEGKIIAGAMIAFVGQSAIYRHSAGDTAYKHIPAMYLIQWEAIKKAKSLEKKIYNFWGIAPIESKHHPWAGLTLFKTGFGGDYEYFLPTLDIPLHVSYWKTYCIDWISSKKKR